MRASGVPRAAGDGARGRARPAVLLAALACGALAACSHSPPAPPNPLPAEPVRKNPKQAAIINMQLSIEFLKIGKLAAARDTIERALKEDANNAQVQETAGVVYERLNDMAKAEHAYATAARIGKDDPEVQNYYAGFLCRTGHAASGEKLFMQVASNPLYQTPEVALVNAGVCIHSSGDLVDSERYFQRALAIRPNMPEALLQLANIDLERGDTAEARATIQRDLAVNPPTPELLWLAVRVERRAQDAAAAANFARRIQVEFPNSEQAQLLRSGIDR